MIDIGWYLSLVGHRTAAEIPGVIERLQACGITSEILDKVLSAPESLLYAPERDGEDWAHDYGGPTGAALLTAELEVYFFGSGQLTPTGYVPPATPPAG